jgi:hypothetical protein
MVLPKTTINKPKPPSSFRPQIGFVLRQVTNERLKQLAREKGVSVRTVIMYVLGRTYPELDIRDEDLAD